MSLPTSCEPATEEAYGPRSTLNVTLPLIVLAVVSITRSFTVPLPANLISDSANVSLVTCLSTVISPVRRSSVLYTSVAEPDTPPPYGMDANICAAENVPGSSISTSSEYGVVLLFASVIS